MTEVGGNIMFVRRLEVDERERLKVTSRPSEGVIFIFTNLKPDYSISRHLPPITR